ncbi:MAG: substrate-binding domain-containing protein, partial [Planctomycetota bacterium]
RRLGVPVVDVRCRRKFQDMPRVDTDDRLVAKLAFEHLRSLGFVRFAFCGYRSIHYSTNRLKFFREFVLEAGFSLSVYESELDADGSVTGTERYGLFDQPAVSAWLETLQRPTGLLACNDIRGHQVLQACRISGIEVPDSLAVVGVDDDDVICPVCDPPLTSVRPNAERIGMRAAELLGELLKGAPVDSRLELIPPSAVTCRLSTQVRASDDPKVAMACRFIREHSCDGIDVKDVVDQSKISRRQLERRFRDALGRSPHQEITATRIAHVKQLLAESTMTLEEIAPLAGYCHKEQLCTVFKRETGHTPTQYRTSQ